MLDVLGYRLSKETVAGLQIAVSLCILINWRQLTVDMCHGGHGQVQVHTIFGSFGVGRVNHIW